jgi:hypothetical protein
MRLNTVTKSCVTALTLAILALTTVAPAADAGGHGRGKGRRYKDGGYESSHRGTVRPGGYRTEYRRSSSSNAGPVIAGVVAGIAIGAAIANSSRVHADVHYGHRGYQSGRAYRRDCGYQGSGHHHAHASRGSCGAGVRSARYAYYDPYCGQRFASFDACGASQRGCDHQRIVRVVDARSGNCVNNYGYRNGGWQAYGPEYGPSYEDEYYGG